MSIKEIQVPKYTDTGELNLNVSSQLTVSAGSGDYASGLSVTNDYYGANPAKTTTLKLGKGALACAVTSDWSEGGAKVHVPFGDDVQFTLSLSRDASSKSLNLAESGNGFQQITLDSSLRDMVRDNYKTLDTTSTKSVETCDSESVMLEEGCSSITLHKVSKTGDYRDLLNPPKVNGVSLGYSEDSDDHTLTLANCPPCKAYSISIRNIAQPEVSMSLTGFATGIYHASIRMSTATSPTEANSTVEVDCGLYYLRAPTVLVSEYHSYGGGVLSIPGEYSSTGTSDTVPFRLHFKAKYHPKAGSVLPHTSLYAHINRVDRHSSSAYLIEDMKEGADNLDFYSLFNSTVTGAWLVLQQVSGTEGKQ